MKAPKLRIFVGMVLKIVQEIKQVTWNQVIKLKFTDSAIDTANDNLDFLDIVAEHVMISKQLINITNSTESFQL